MAWRDRRAVLTAHHALYVSFLVRSGRDLTLLVSVPSLVDRDGLVFFARPETLREILGLIVGGASVGGASCWGMASQRSHATSKQLINNFLWGDAN